MVLFGCVNDLKISTRIVNLGLSIVIVDHYISDSGIYANPEELNNGSFNENALESSIMRLPSARLEVISHIKAVELVLSSFLMS